MFEFQPRVKSKSKTPRLDMSGWASYFPKDQKEEKDRLMFLAKMGYVAIANYAYYRNLVSLSALKRRRVDGM